MTLNIVNFIKENENWEELLSSPPYSLKIRKKEDLILFKYSQFASDFSLEIVREARGLILENRTWKVVSYPFKKFFNFGEPFVDEIDWASARVNEKVDGTLIKIYYYDGKWRIGTNGTIDASDAELSSSPYRTFMELFNAAADICGLNYNKLDTHFTYIFELRSPYNKIVVPYDDIRIIHIGTRDNRNCEEVEVDIGIEKPKQYMLSSLDDCIAMAATFDFTQEGFVVVDKNFNRCKIKSPAYLAMHYAANPANYTDEKIIDIIRQGETDEILAYFPQLSERFSFFSQEIKDLENFVNEQSDTFKSFSGTSCQKYHAILEVTKIPSLVKGVKNGQSWKEMNQFWTSKKLLSILNDFRKEKK